MAGAVTLHDCAMFLVLLLSGVIVALLAGERFGWPGALLGLPTGFLGLLGLLLGVGWIAVLLERGWLPACHEGHSGGTARDPLGDYETVWVDDETGRQSHQWQEGYEMYWRCPECGREYAKVDRRFMQRMPDGTLKPYMVWRLFRGYVPERGEKD